MRKLWLIFAQSATVCMAVVFVVSTLRPDLLPIHRQAKTDNVVTVKEAPIAPRHEPPSVGYSPAARKAMASVVNIFTSKQVKSRRNPLLDDPLLRRFFGEQGGDAEPQRASSLGSGVIVGPEGFIVTNHHVIESADDIEIALADGSTHKAKLVGTDPDSDLAVLKVDSKQLPAITFGSSEGLKVGDVVLAVGNPFGVGQTVTMGIVSALGRSHLNINTFEDFIQTDAAINPGNSGGALVDSAGNLVGINSAIYSRSGGNVGIGFAIPVSLARRVMDQIIATGAVTRGWIGVEVQDLTAELAESFKVPSTKGTLIAGVIKGAPADKAGMKAGDVLVKVDGQQVTDASSMLNLIAGLRPGEAAALTVMRNGAEVPIKVTVGKRPRPTRRDDEE